MEDGDRNKGSSNQNESPKLEASCDVEASGREEETLPTKMMTCRIRRVMLLIT